MQRQVLLEYRPRRHPWPQLAKVVATPHLAASTEEAQEQVGLDTANAVRDYLKSGAVRDAVNFPAAVPADELQRLQPWLKLAEGLAAVASQMGPARVDQIALRYYGGLAESAAASLLASSAAAGVLRPILSGGVSVVKAQIVIEAVPSKRSSCTTTTGRGLPA